MQKRGRARAIAGAAFTAALVAGGSAPAELLDKAIEKRIEGNLDEVEAQQRIDELSDETERMLAEYRNTLKQIESLRIYNRQSEALVRAQEEEKASLQKQIDEVEVVGRGVAPLMFKMIEALDQFVHLDTPFLMEERERRVADLRELMDRSDVTDAEKFRRILEAYQIENEFGRTIEAYRGTLDRGGRELTVDFLRVGRIALVYQTLDRARNGVWDQTSGEWRELDASYASAIRQGLRVARKQAAPDMIRLPLPAPERTGGGV